MARAFIASLGHCYFSCDLMAGRPGSGTAMAVIDKLLVLLHVVHHLLVDTLRELDLS